MLSRACFLLFASVAADYSPLPGVDTTYETVVASDEAVYVKKGDQVKVHATVCTLSHLLVSQHQRIGSYLLHFSVVHASAMSGRR
jgi:hypothetical protein